MSTIPAQLLDEEWRISHLYKIVDTYNNLVVFTPNEHQAHYRAERKLRNIILKSRQLGFTTQACIEMLDACIFHKNYNAIIIAHDKESLQRIFHKVEIAWDNMDARLKAWLGIKCLSRTRSQIEFNNGSRLAISLSTRSDTVNWLHISEFGKICAKYPLKATEIITGAIPSVPKSGRITIESTAEGETGRFYEMFWEAWEREPRTEEEFKAFFFSWVKDYKYRSTADIPLTKEQQDYQTLYSLDKQQITWHVIQKQTLKHLMEQEFPTDPVEAFVSSGRKVFDAKVLSWKIKEIDERIASGEWEAPRKVGDWVYYAYYRPGHRYAVGVDVAGGSGLDHSAIVIIDFSTKTPVIVARYMNNRITPETLPYEIVAGANLYGNPIVAVERNNHGGTTINVLRDIYPNLYTEVIKDKTTDQSTERLGFLTTAKSKSRIIFNFKSAVNEGDIDIPDKTLLREAQRFDHVDLDVVKSKIDEDTSRHFDLLMATCIAYEMMTEVGSGGIATMIEPNLVHPHKSIQ